MPGFFFVPCVAGGSPSALRFACTRGASQEPAGATLGATLRRPAREGPRIAAVYLLPYGPGRASTGVFRLDILSREKGRPSWPAPCGPDPADALASATGPEGGTHRLFLTVRSIAGIASSATRACNADRAPSQRILHPRNADPMPGQRRSWVGADESAPTTGNRSAVHLITAGGALDLTPPQSSEEPAGIALGAGSAGEVAHRKKPEGGRPGRPTVFARQDVESETAGGAPTRPVGQ